MQLFTIVREIQRHPAGRGVNSGSAGRRKRLGEVLFRCRAHLRQVFEPQVEVVEYIGNIPIRQGGLRSGLRGNGRSRVLGRLPAGSDRGRSRHRSALNGAALDDAEFGDDLLLALVEEPKVFLAQVPNGVALAVAHHNRYGNQIHLAAERRRGLARRYLRVVLKERSANS
jgi:hypothetical protein